MSTASRVRKSSPVKQGPMRATIPMSSLLKQNTGFRKSPTLSPTTTTTITATSVSNWRCRSSPDNTMNANSGQRSPGSVTYKAKSKLDALTSKGGGNIIRRTASLDTIYLKGQWPRDTFYFQCGLLQVDKATQTEEPSSIIKCFRNVTTGTDESPSPTSSCLNEEKCFHRQRQRSSKERDRVYNMCCISSTTIDNSATTITTTTATKACPVNIPIIKPMIKPPMRNSIEGLNQEIERLVLKGNFCNSSRNSSSPKGALQLRSTSNNSMEREDFELDLQLNLNLNLDEITPEGHRAPLADLLRSTRSVNTQTPSAGPFQRKSDSGSGSLSESNSNSPEDDDDDQLCCSSSRFFSTSPHINRFLAREPPDGCERVNLRFYEDTGVSTLLNPPNVTFQLKPSLGSAFQPLKIHHNTDDSDSSNINSNNNTQTPG